jgi:uncharacterized ferredoxin-like protein
MVKLDLRERGKNVKWFKGPQCKVRWWTTLITEGNSCSAENQQLVEDLIM